MTVPNTQILKHEVAIEQEKHHPRGSIQDGFRVCGWLWRKDPVTWRWTFTTSLHVRGYPSTADFIVVYAKPSFITDLSTRPTNVETERNHSPRCPLPEDHTGPCPLDPGL